MSFYFTNSFILTLAYVFLLFRKTGLIVEGIKGIDIEKELFRTQSGI